MLADYDRRRVLVWTDEASNAFEAVKADIADCPLLYFPEAHGEIVVQTDASDYGIGAYVCQRCPSDTGEGTVERPIAMISKALSGSQLNWSTPEKEAYAIYYTLTSLSYLLRDVPFVIQTGHKNLTYLNMDGSSKVKRWKMEIQDFDFYVEHIAGKLNIIADTFSRLCLVTEPEVLAYRNLMEYDEVHVSSTTRQLIRKVAHNSFVGHGGLERTLRRLRSAGHNWDGMRRQVRRVIWECPVCQKLSAIKVPIQCYPFTTATYEPMECINIDSIGPLPEDADGHKHILVVIDCFTRFLELYPLKSTDSNEAAAKLINHAGRYGFPDRIRSDQGTQFVNERIEDLKTILGSQSDLTIAYSKEENAIVERANKEVLRHLKAIVFDKRFHSKWGIHDLPVVQRIFNTEVKQATGVSPAALFFGNALQLDRQIFVDRARSDDGNSSRPLSKWADNMLARQAQLITIAQDHQRQADQYHMSEAHSGSTIEYPVGSYLLVSYPDNPPDKLRTQWQGPMQVVSAVGTKYTVQNLVNYSMYTVHIGRLKKFEYDAQETDPKVVAMHDMGEFLIDSITAHRGQRSSTTNQWIRSSLEFLVRWGPGGGDDSWEPWHNLLRTEQLHDYLRTHKMKSLIPSYARSAIADGELAVND